MNNKYKQQNEQLLLRYLKGTYWKIKYVMMGIVRMTSFRCQIQQIMQFIEK